MSNRKNIQQSIGRDAAITLHDSKWWEGKTHREIAEFQMATQELCVPFSVFHEAMEKTLGRPVFTHEFGLNFDGLLGELMGEKEPPSFEQIMAMIPQDKLILVATGGEA